MHCARYFTMFWSYETEYKVSLPYTKSQTHPTEVFFSLILGWVSFVRGQTGVPVVNPLIIHKQKNFKMACLTYVVREGHATTHIPTGEPICTKFVLKRYIERTNVRLGLLTFDILSLLSWFLLSSIHLFNLPKKKTNEEKQQGLVFFDCDCYMIGFFCY